MHFMRRRLYKLNFNLVSGHFINNLAVARPNIYISLEEADRFFTLISSNVAAKQWPCFDFNKILPVST